MKDAIIERVEEIIDELNNGSTECLIDIYDEIENEIEVDFEGVVVRKPYSKDSGFVEIEINENEYLFVKYRWDYSNSIHNPKLKIWVCE